MDHRQLLKEHLKYRDFEGAPFLRVTRMLLSKLRISAESTGILIDAITQDLEWHKVVLPRIKRITALIGQVRRHEGNRLNRQITLRLSRRQRTQLDALLLVPSEPGVYRTGLETLRSSPLVSSGLTLGRALTDEIAYPSDAGSDARISLHQRQTRGVYLGESLERFWSKSSSIHLAQQAREIPNLPL